ncbi:hypothetical protein M758_UG030000 [Ceratodon purpureus]|nr:hypothetical protein M758_UG030000 [Ceratodon purpureus]
MFEFRSILTFWRGCLTSTKPRGRVIFAIKHVYPKSHSAECCSLATCYLSNYELSERDTEEINLSRQSWLELLQHGCTRHVTCSIECNVSPGGRQSLPLLTELVPIT